MLRIDPRNDSVSFSDPIDDSDELKEVSQRPPRWVGAVYSPVDGRIYAAPVGSKRVLAITPPAVAGGEMIVEKIGPDIVKLAELGNNKQLFGCAIYSPKDQVIYCIPNAARRVLRIAPVARDDATGQTITFVGEALDTANRVKVQKQSRSYKCAALGIDQCIFAPPMMADHILMIEPSAGVVALREMLKRDESATRRGIDSDHLQDAAYPADGPDTLAMKLVSRMLERGTSGDDKELTHDLMVLAPSAPSKWLRESHLKYHKYVPLKLMCELLITLTRDDVTLVGTILRGAGLPAAARLLAYMVGNDDRRDSGLEGKLIELLTQCEEVTRLLVGMSQKEASEEATSMAEAWLDLAMSSEEGAKLAYRSLASMTTETQMELSCLQQGDPTKEHSLGPLLIRLIARVLSIEATLGTPEKDDAARLDREQKLKRVKPRVQTALTLSRLTTKFTSGARGAGSKKASNRKTNRKGKDIQGHIKDVKRGVQKEAQRLSSKVAPEGSNASSRDPADAWVTPDTWKPLAPLLVALDPVAVCKALRALLRLDRDLFQYDEGRFVRGAILDLKSRLQQQYLSCVEEEGLANFAHDGLPEALYNQWRNMIEDDHESSKAARSMALDCRCVSAWLVDAWMKAGRHLMLGRLIEESKDSSSSRLMEAIAWVVQFNEGVESQAVGRKWKKLRGTMPADGKVLEAPKLVDELKRYVAGDTHDVSFDTADLIELQVQGLEWDSCVKVNDAWFQPAMPQIWWRGSVAAETAQEGLLLPEVSMQVAELVPLGNSPDPVKGTVETACQVLTMASRTLCVIESKDSQGAAAKLANDLLSHISSWCDSAIRASITTSPDGFDTVLRHLDEVSSNRSLIASMVLSRLVSATKSSFATFFDRGASTASNGPDETTEKQRDQIFKVWAEMIKDEGGRMAVVTCIKEIMSYQVGAKSVALTLQRQRSKQGEDASTFLTLHSSEILLFLLADKDLRSVAALILRVLAGDFGGLTSGSADIGPFGGAHKIDAVLFAQDLQPRRAASAAAATFAASAIAIATDASADAAATDAGVSTEGGKAKPPTLVVQPSEASSVQSESTAQRRSSTTPSSNSTTPAKGIMARWGSKKVMSRSGSKNRTDVTSDRRDSVKDSKLQKSTHDNWSKLSSHHGPARYIANQANETVAGFLDALLEPMLARSSREINDRTEDIFNDQLADVISRLPGLLALVRAAGPGIERYTEIFEVQVNMLTHPKEAVDAKLFDKNHLMRQHPHKIDATTLKYLDGLGKAVEMSLGTDGLRNKVTPDASRLIEELASLKVPAVWVPSYFVSEHPLGETEGKAYCFAELALHANWGDARENTPLYQNQLLSRALAHKSAVGEWISRDLGTSGTTQAEVNEREIILLYFQLISEGSSDDLRDEQIAS